MARSVVLLRGVNVGKGKRVPMAEFRALLEDLGHADVRTLLNSGNAVLRSGAAPGVDPAAAIAAGVRERFGVDTPVILRSAQAWRAIVDANPMPPSEAEASRFVVAFAQDDAALLALRQALPAAQPPERLVIGAHAAYLHCPRGLLQSPTGKALLGRAGAAVTTRNWATVLKLAALLEA